MKQRRSYWRLGVFCILFAVLFAGCGKGKDGDGADLTPTKAGVQQTEGVTPTKEMTPTATPTPTLPPNWTDINDKGSLHQIQMDYTVCKDASLMQAVLLDGRLYVYAEFREGNAKILRVDPYLGVIENELDFEKAIYEAYGLAPALPGESGEQVICLKDAASSCLIYMDENLQITQKISYAGKGESQIVSSDRTKMFYVKEDSKGYHIKEVRLSDGTEQDYTDLIDEPYGIFLQGLYFQDEVLAVTANDADYNGYSYLIDLKTKTLYGKYKGFLALQTEGDRYFCIEQNYGGDVITGDRKKPEEAMALLYTDEVECYNSAYFLPNGVDQAGIIVTAHSETVGFGEDKKEKKILKLYDIAAKRLFYHAETKPGTEILYLQQPIGLDAENNWLIGMYDTEEGEYFYVWEYDQDAAAEEEQAFEAYENFEFLPGRVPEQITKEFERIEKTYGVQLSLDAETVTAMSDYEAADLTNVRIVHKSLRVLETALKHLPEGILQQMGEKTDIIIYLCGELHGEVDYAAGLHTGIGACSMITFDCTQIAGMERTVYHEFMHAIDEYLTIYTDVDNCEPFLKLNPENFWYNGNYSDYFENPDDSYTLDQDPAQAYFVDAYAKCFLLEDRARTFEFGMLYGRDYYAAAPHLLAKLDAITANLREAFDSENWPEDIYTR